MRIFFLGLALALAGCSGVILSAAYHDSLSTQAALTETAATRAEAGQLTTQESAHALRAEATYDKRLLDAADGKASK